MIKIDAVMCGENSGRTMWGMPLGVENMRSGNTKNMARNTKNMRSGNNKNMRSGNTKNMRSGNTKKHEVREH